MSFAHGQLTQTNYQLFEAILNKFTQALKSTNTFIIANQHHTCSHDFKKRPDIAYIMFLLNNMLEAKIAPNSYILCDIIESLGMIMQADCINLLYSFIMAGNIEITNKEMTIIHTHTIKALGRCQDVSSMEIVYNTAMNNRETSVLTHTTVMDQAGRFGRYDLAVRAFNEYYKIRKGAVCIFACSSMITAAGIAKNEHDSYIFLQHAVDNKIANASICATLSKYAKVNGWIQLQNIADTLYEEISPSFASRVTQTTRITIDSKHQTTQPEHKQTSVKINNTHNPMITYQAGGRATESIKITTYRLDQIGGYVAAAAAPATFASHQTSGPATRPNLSHHQASGSASSTTQHSYSHHQASGSASSTTQHSYSHHQASGSVSSTTQHSHSHHQASGSASSATQRRVPFTNSPTKNRSPITTETACPHYLAIANATPSEVSSQKKMRLSAKAVTFRPVTPNEIIVFSHSAILQASATASSDQKTTHTRPTITPMSISTASPVLSVSPKTSPKPVGTPLPSNPTALPHLDLSTTVSYGLFTPPLKTLFTPITTTPLVSPTNTKGLSKN